MMEIIIGVTLQYCFNILFILILAGIPKKVLLFASLSLISLVIQGMLFSQFGIFFVFYIVTSLTLLFYLTAKNLSRIFLTVPLGIVLAIIGDHFSNVVTLFLNGNLITGLTATNLFLHLFIAFLISLGFTTFIKVIIFPKINDQQLPMYSLMLYFLLIIYYIFIIATNYSGYNKSIVLFENVFFVLFFLCTCIVAFLYKKTLDNRLKQEIYEKEVELQINYIKKIEHSYEELRTFKHDYKSLLFTLDSYIKERDLDGLTIYFEKNILPTNRFFENKIGYLSLLDLIQPKEVRSVFRIKIMEANEKKIYPKIIIPMEIKIPKYLFLEISEVMGILLDNATEEMIQEDFQTGYEIICKETTNMIVITVKNPSMVKIPLFQLKERGFSTKESRNSGIGLAILEEIINSKYQLSLETTVEDQVFSQTVYIRKD